MAVPIEATGLIFNDIDVVESYDKGHADDGWVRKLNENFSVLEQLIFAGSGSLSISAAGFSLNRLVVDVGSELATDPGTSISVASGLAVTLHDSTMSLFKMVCTSSLLSATPGSPAGSNVGVGGLDNSSFGSWASDQWVHYYIVGGGKGSSIPEALVISANADEPSLGAGFDSDLTFFRRLGTARWIGLSSSFLVGQNIQGTTRYRDDNNILNGNPGTQFQLLDASSTIPPTSTRGEFTIVMAESNDAAQSYWYVGSSDQEGSSSGGQIIAARGPSQTSGASSWMINHFPYDVDSTQKFCIRRVDQVATLFQVHSNGYTEAL